MHASFSPIEEGRERGGKKDIDREKEGEKKNMDEEEKAEEYVTMGRRRRVKKKY